LAEIKRRPIVNKIIDIIRKYNIDHSDIWDCNKTNLEKEIRAIFNRRNMLTHASEPMSGLQMYKDLIRLQALCERIILAVLEFRDNSKIFIAAYRDLHFLARD